MPGGAALQLITRSFGDRRVPINPRSARDDGCAGYALTDAIVAMLILSMSLAICFGALARARDAAAAAEEMRRADALISYLMTTTPHREVPSSGVTDGFKWTLRLGITGAERPIAVCQRDVALESSKSGRVFRAATLETCPPAPAA